MVGAASTLGFDDERQVDFGAVWRRLAKRWWLLLGGSVVGAVLGVAVAVGGGSVYEAQTLLYLGQPFAPGGGPIQSLATNPDTAAEIVRSERVIKRAAAAAGLRVGRLRGDVRTRAIVAPGQGVRAFSPLVEITVYAAAAAQAETAADSLAQSVIGSVSPYVDRKIELLDQQIAKDEAGLETATARIQAALRQQAAARDPGLSLAERVLVRANSNATLQFYEARQASLRQDEAAVRQRRSFAEQVERSAVIEGAVAVRTVANSPRNAALIGAVLGLLLGGLLAYLADPFVQRRNPSQKG